MKTDYAKEIYKQLVSEPNVSRQESNPTSRSDELRFSNKQLMVISWGAHSFETIDNITLQFRVRGNVFKGSVQISYEVGEGAYTLSFINQEEQGSWRVRHHVNHVRVDDLHDVIDAYIEWDRHI